MSLKLRVSIIFEDSSSLDASDREFQQDHAGYRILALPVNSYENENGKSPIQICWSLKDFSI